MFIYAHCAYICSLSLDMHTIFIYAHCDCICPLCLYMLLLTDNNCFVEPPLLYFYYFYYSPLLSYYSYFHYFYYYSLCYFFGNHQLLFSKTLISSPLFCQWWNCLTPETIWNMCWWSWTCEELGIITSRPYCLFLYAHCFYKCSLCLWCFDAPSSWSNDDWHVSEASTTATTRFLIYCYFIGLL